MLKVNENNLFEQLGIQRITLELPFRLNHVHCFLAKGRNGWTIIDAGLHTEATKKTWDPIVDDKNISDIIITHYHPDHLGYASQLQLDTGADVWITETDQIQANRMYEKERRAQLIRSYKEYGLSQQIVNEMTNSPRLMKPLPNITRNLREGDEIQFGNLCYEVIFTPGHSGGLICLYSREERILLSTDHILPTISPNIALHILGDEDPLSDYLDSLAKMKQLPIDVAIPSHGDPFFHVHERIEELENHHKSRLNLIVDTLSKPMTPMEVCEQIFRRHLTVHELRFALGETLSHLEYLFNKGKCKRDFVNGEWKYFTE